MRNSFKSIAVAAGLLGFAAAGSLKADAPAAPKWYDKVAVSGYIDAYYQYDFNGFTSNDPTPSNSSGKNVPGRAFDTTSNEFTLNAAKLGLSWSDSGSGTGAELDLLYGAIANIVNAQSLNNYDIGSTAIEQAYVTQAFGPVTFKLGKFGTFVGTEVTDTPGNMNYSRSILFGVIPFYHTGLMATYSVMDGLGVSGYIGDGNSVDYASTEDKDYGAQITYTGVKNLSLIFNYYTENFRDDGTFVTPNEVLYNKEYLNLLGSYTVMDGLSVAGELLYETEVLNTNVTGIGSSYNPKQQGYCVYVNYTTPIAGLSLIPRFEQWYTADDYLAGETIVGASGPLSEFTLTAKYAKGPLTHYLEYRLDNDGDAKIYPTSGAPVSKQGTLTYAAVYSY